MSVSVQEWEWGPVWALQESPRALSLDLARLGQTRPDEKSDKAPTAPEARARMYLPFPVSVKLARSLAPATPHGEYA